MLDPRIYRTGFIVVAFAVIVLAFSFGDQQGGLRSTLAPEAFNGQDAYVTMNKLAARYPHRAPGSPADAAIARYVAAQLRGDGFSVASSSFAARTVDGTRRLQTVTATLAGLTSGTVVVVAHRDALQAPSAADLSGTAVLLELARALSGETQSRSIVLASTSGTAGDAGAAELARRIPGPVDAVLVLGDLAGAGAEVRQPIVVPWSNTTRVAPTMLRNTLASALAAQTGLASGGTSFGGQFMHLALPLGVSGQAPFNSQGVPAVLLSLSGARPPARDEATSADQITALGRAVLSTVGALSAGAEIPPPSTYLLYSQKVLPAWAVRLLVLALMVPVFAATIDGFARARRRRHPLTHWLTWVLATALPFALAAIAVLALRVVGRLDGAPPGPLSGEAIALHGSAVAVMIGLGVIVLAGFAFVRPALIRAVAGSGRLESAGGGGAAAALMVVLCLVALAVWLANPFTAALIVPALHLWMWAVAPSQRPRRALSVALLLAGLVLPALAVLYYAHTLALTPAQTLWSAVLQLAGGGVGAAAALEASLLLGCAATVALIVWDSVRHAPERQDVPITVRGPITYAGPGSLGGTGSALRR